MDPYRIIIKPHITEKTVRESYGDPTQKDESQLVRKYTFVVAPDANKIQIKQAIEAIYNAGKKKKSDDLIKVTNVRTITVRGKTRNRNFRAVGKRSDWKKAIITLERGQLLEDYGV